MSSTGISILGKNGSNLEAIASTSNALKMDLASASHGALNVNDSTAQSSLSSINSSLSGTLNVSDSTAQSSLSSISSSVSGTLSVSDSTAQSSLSSINSALSGSLTVSDSAAQASLSTIAGDTSSLDSKFSQGYDAQISSGGSGLVQIGLYGRDNSGNWDAVNVENNGDIKVSLDDIDSVKGQASMANSLPVVIASDQSNIAVTMGALSSTSTTTHSSVSVSNLTTSTSSSVDLNAVREVSVIGNVTEYGSEIEILASDDDATYYKMTDISVFSDYNNGDFVKSFKANARYVKVKYVNDSGSSQTITSKICYKS
jgi:hypothetical protein